MTHVREINDPQDLAALRPQWSALLQRTQSATYCHSLDWLETYWKHFGAGKRLRVLVVEDDDEVVGILPFAVWAAHRTEPIKSLTYPLDYWGNFYGPIGPDPLVTLTAGLEHIRRTPRDWHFIELQWVDALADDGRTQFAFDRAGIHAVCEARQASAIVDLAHYGSWDAYCASHNSKWRNTLGRQEKKLARRGAVTYVRHRTSGTGGSQADPKWDIYEACEAVSRASWQGNAKNGTMLNKDLHRAYFRECHQKGIENGSVDVNVIFVDGQPAAFGYNYVYRGRVTEVKVAYDPAFAFEGAGTVLQARTIADSFARGDHTIELGHEYMYWKRVWATHFRPVNRYLHFPTMGVAAQVIRGKRAIERQLRATMRRWRSPNRIPAEAASPC
jgi:CelD/BcsL family acetyltransferase involved in cellulose biosynthesis